MQYAIIIHINYLFILCINNVINMMYFKLSDLLLLAVARSAIRRMRLKWKTLGLSAEPESNCFNYCRVFLILIWWITKFLFGDKENL